MYMYNIYKYLFYVYVFPCVSIYLHIYIYIHVFQGPRGTSTIVSLLTAQEDALSALAGLWDVKPQFRDISQTPSRHFHVLKSMGFMWGCTGCHVLDRTMGVFDVRGKALACQLLFSRYA